LQKAVDAHKTRNFMQDYAFNTPNLAKLKCMRDYPIFIFYFIKKHVVKFKERFK